MSHKARTRFSDPLILSIFAALLTVAPAGYVFYHLPIEGQRSLFGVGYVLIVMLYPGLYRNFRKRNSGRRHPPVDVVDQR